MERFNVLIKVLNDEISCTSNEYIKKEMKKLLVQVHHISEALDEEVDTYIEDISKEVCKEFNISIQDLMLRNRQKKNINYARNIHKYLLRTQLGLKNREISKFTTDTFRAVKKVQKYKLENPEVYRKLEKIKQNLKL